MLWPLTPLLAAPMLWAGLQKIARMPTGRLPVGYKIIPRVAFEHPLNAPAQPRPLGVAWYVDRLVAGGIVGETLPLSIVRGLDTTPAINQALLVDRRAAMLGGQLDVFA